MNSIVIDNLVKRYDNKVVLNHLSLNIEEGEFYCLMGPNGSGKTTLSSIIASIVKPDSGDVSIYGKKPRDAKKLLGYIPQESFTDPNLTGFENLYYFARLLGYKKNHIKIMAEDLLNKVGLFGEKDKRVAKYSGGMRKKLELATILFPGIKVLILDEPTTGLDPSARRNFFGLIDDIKDKSITILLISHIGSDAEIASKVGFISQGRIMEQGSPEELKNNSGLKNVINIEVSVKNEKVKKILDSFSSGKELLETEKGYKIYSDEASEAIPKVVRAVEKDGYKVIQVGSVIPSLEDVFYILTGNRCSEPQE